MKINKLFTFFLCALIIIVCLSTAAYSENKSGGNLKNDQKVVYALKDGKTHLLAGDSEANKYKGNENKVLPLLLEAGWRIKKVSMTASAAVNPDQVLAILILEK